MACGPDIVLEKRFLFTILILVIQCKSEKFVRESDYGKNIKNNIEPSNFEGAKEKQYILLCYQ